MDSVPAVPATADLGALLDDLSLEMTGKDAGKLEEASGAIPRPPTRFEAVAAAGQKEGGPEHCPRPPGYCFAYLGPFVNAAHASAVDASVPPSRSFVSRAKTVWRFLGC